MGRRIGLFLVLNFTVILVLGILSSVLGLNAAVNQQQYLGLFGFCLFWGMGGAFISLQLSRWMAKKAMGVQLIDPQSYNPSERWLVERVHSLALKAGMQTMPEVGIYEANEVNAFATGPSKKRALVAVSSGLLRRMNKEEMEGVLAHEIAHIANGDMVTMALLTGVVNAFVMFLARVIAMAIDNAMRGRGGERGGLGFIGRFVVIMVLQTTLMVPGSMVIAAFSRWREFRADQGGAKLAGKDKMKAALEALVKNVGLEDPGTERAQKSVAAMKISSRRSGFLALMATHPPLEERIRRLS